MTKDIKQTEAYVQLKMEKKLHKRERTLRNRLQDARESQAEALERFKRAEARLEKRTLRTQNLEARLQLVSQQLGTLQASQVSIDQIAQTLSIANDEDVQIAEPQPETIPVLVTEYPIFPLAPPLAETTMVEWFAKPLSAEAELELLEVHAIEQDISVEPVEASDTDEPASEDVGTYDTDEPASEDVGAYDENLPAVTAIISLDEANGLAKIARAVAETAEYAARLAIERAVEVETRLEQMSSGRHLIQELEQTQSEADRASAVAQQTHRAAEEAEHLAAETAMQVLAMPNTETPLFVSEEAIIEEIRDIEEEAAMVEAITAKLIADAAAAAAAEAEALAEASSSRTREAQRLVVEADHALDNVYAAFLDGSMPEDEAQTRLLQAEHQATRAHAMLADAEATEEAAINAARNAEAEAEVAEGMAFASNNIAEYHFDVDLAPVLTVENELSDNSEQPDIGDTVDNANTEGEVNTTLNANNADATVKMRKIYPRQPM